MSDEPKDKCCECGNCIIYNTSLSDYQRLCCKIGVPNNHGIISFCSGFKPKAKTDKMKRLNAEARELMSFGKKPRKQPRKANTIMLNTEHYPGDYRFGKDPLDDGC